MTGKFICASTNVYYARDHFIGATANLNNRSCIATLQGHTSLVGQLQMRGDILVTGGSDGSIRVWDIPKKEPIHRLAAHDNSVTSLQFDNTRIVSGGSDGRVKVWDLRKGTLVRELSSPAEAVWRVVFEEEKCVIMAQRNNRTVMEVSQPRNPFLSKPFLCMYRSGHLRHPKRSSMTAYLTQWSTIPDNGRILQHYQPHRHILHHLTRTTSPWKTQTPKTLKTKKTLDLFPVLIYLSVIASARLRAEDLNLSRAFVHVLIDTSCPLPLLSTLLSFAHRMHASSSIPS